MTASSTAAMIDVMKLAAQLLEPLWRAVGRRTAAILLLLSTGLLFEAGILAALLPTLTTLIGPSGAAPKLAKASWALPSFSGGGLNQLPTLLVLIVVMGMIRMILSGARDLRLLDVQLRFVESERRQITRTLAFASWEKIARLDHARATSALTSEMQRLSACAQAILQACVAIPSLLLQIGFALWLAPLFTAAMLGLALLGVVALAVAQRSLFELGTVITRANQTQAANMRAMLAQMKTAAAQNTQNDLVNELDVVHEELITQQLNIRRTRYRRGVLFSFVLMTLVLTTVLVGLFGFHIRQAELLFLLLLFARMINPGLQIASAGQSVIVSLPAFASLRTLQAEVGSVEPPSPQQGRAALPGDLSLRGVTFRYAEGFGVQGVNLTIPPGRTIGISGESGHGKTTLMDLIAGILKPQGGELAVGEAALAHGVLGQWQAQLAYVVQDSSLFPDTVRRNLTWGGPMVCDATLVEALRLVGAEEFVSLAGGLDVVVGERGVRFSGGQCQRLLIAGALVRRPRWLLLDEAMNALDEDAETDLLDRLAAMPDRPTIILTSHRRQTIARCDQIVSVKAGRIEA